MIIQILAFTLAVIAYTISQLQQHGKLKWSNNKYGFWGNESDLRKYKGEVVENVASLELAPDNWYYRWFKIDFEERFPGSATIFVGFTDGYHLMQMIMKISLSIALAGISWWAVVWFVGFGIVFTVVYRYLSKA